MECHALGLLASFRFESSLRLHLVSQMSDSVYYERPPVFYCKKYSIKIEAYLLNQKFLNKQYFYF